MDSGHAAPSGGGRKHARKSAGAASDTEQAEARKLTAAEEPLFDGGTVDGAGRDGLDRAAEVLSGAGQDTPTTAARLSVVGQLPELPADRYLDREESWLRFSQRVLELAEDPNVPLL
ncbi:MAG TPA: hypothetical protein VF940_03590, partial [Streptosporangiaceae bacterium]